MVVVGLLVLAALLVVGIGLAFVGYAVDKTAAMPAQIVIDAHESIDFVAEALPIEVSSVVSFDDVRRVLRYHIEWIQSYHWAPAGSSDGPIVFEEYDALGYVMERAEINGLDIDPAHAAAIISAHDSYLQVVGAIHIDDPVDVEADLAELPLLDAPRLDGPRTDGELDNPDQTGDD